MGSPNHPSHWTIWSPKVLQADSNIHPEWLDAFWGAGKNSKTGFPLWSHEIPVISFTSQKSSEYCMIAAPKQIQHDLTLKNLEIMDKTNSSKRPPGKKERSVSASQFLAWEEADVALRVGQMATAAIPRLIQFQNCFLQLQRELLDTWPLGNQGNALIQENPEAAYRNNQENGQISSLSLGSWVVLPSGSLVVTRGLLEKTVSSLAAVESGSPRWFVHGWFFFIPRILVGHQASVEHCILMLGKCWKSKKIPWPLKTTLGFDLSSLRLLARGRWTQWDYARLECLSWKQTELRMCLFFGHK